MQDSNSLAMTNHQIVLGFLAKNPDAEFYEREIARKTEISFGSANKVLNDLHAQGYVLRQQKGRMFFYSVNEMDPVYRNYKIFYTTLLIRPLIKKLIPDSHKIILYGSCAAGTDTSRSDIDIFIVSDKKAKILKAIGDYTFQKGFTETIIEPVIYSPQDLLQSEKNNRDFLSLIREGIVLWDKTEHES
jgi:predicted nucleotidyltransferase